MARMSDNDECPSRDFGDSLQLTNWVLDSRATFHMMPNIQDFIPGLLECTDNHVKLTDRNHVTAKQKDKYEEKCVSITKILYRNISQRNFGIISMRQVILHYYVTEFGTYLFIIKVFFQGELWR